MAVYHYDVIYGGIPCNSKLKHSIKRFRKQYKNLNYEVEADGLNEEQYVPPIYNVVSSSSNPLTWGEFSHFNKTHGLHVPSVKAVSAPKTFLLKSYST